MKISLSWLEELIDLTSISLADLTHRLTMSGIEVTDSEQKSPRFTQVIVGRIIKVFSHPNADKLQLTEVEVPGATLQIVCGAKNISAGDIVPVALEGAQLPGGIQIKRTLIRGQESMGMLCSERELGITEDAQGIMHFPADTPLGMPVNQILGLNDTLLEVEITPNRSDCLSHLGIARHLSAILNRPLKTKALVINEFDPGVAHGVQVQVEPQAGCRRYCARIIQGVTIAPSPLWLQKRLEAVGLRPINNVVDVTNYILMEIGHPLHAFDQDRLNGQVIQARQAKAGEGLVTIDKIVRKFSGGELVIADKEKPIALAGIMGGLATEVTEQSKNILIEAAWFDPAVIRKASRKLGLQSESSYRFERGIDPEQGLRLALDRAAEMIAKIAGGKILRGVLDVYPDKISKKTITFRLAKAQKVLGMKLEPVSSVAALSRLGFQIDEIQPQVYQVTVPSFRQDISIEEDLIEEVAEVMGYDRIPCLAPLVSMDAPRPERQREFHLQLRQWVADLGLTEIITYSFIDPNHWDRLRLLPEHPWRNALTLKNPSSPELSKMRTSLLPGLIDTLGYNQRRDQERVYLFETGAVFIPQDHLQETLPQEVKHLGIILAGPRQPLSWRSQQSETGFYDLKGILDELFWQLHREAVILEPADYPFLHSRVSFSLKASQEKNVGWTGRLHPAVEEQYKLKGPVFVAEINCDLLEQLWLPRMGVKSISRFPASKRDIALAVPEDTLAGEIMQAIQIVGGDQLVKITPFDWYQGEGISAGMKSLAFSLTFQALDRTLNEEDVNQLQARILTHLQNHFGAKQR